MRFWTDLGGNDLEQSWTLGHPSQKEVLINGLYNLFVNKIKFLTLAVEGGGEWVDF